MVASFRGPFGATRPALVAFGMLIVTTNPKGALADGKPAVNPIGDFYQHGGWVADPRAEDARLAAWSNPPQVEKWRAGPSRDVANAIELGRKAEATGDVGEDLLGILSRAEFSASSFGSTGVPEARRAFGELSALVSGVSELVDAARLTGDLDLLPAGSGKDPPRTVHVDRGKVTSSIRTAVNDGNAAVKRGAVSSALMRRLEVSRRVAQRFGALPATIDDLRTVSKEAAELRAVARIVHGSPEASVSAAEARAKVKAALDAVGGASNGSAQPKERMRLAGAYAQALATLRPVLAWPPFSATTEGKALAVRAMRGMLGSLFADPQFAPYRGANGMLDPMKVIAPAMAAAARSPGLQSNPIFRAQTQTRYWVNPNLHPEARTEASRLSTLAWEREKAGARQEAIRLYRKSLAVLEHAFGPRSFDMVGPLTMDASALERLGLRAEGLAVLNRAIAIMAAFEAEEGKDGYAGMTLRGLYQQRATMLRADGKLQEAQAAEHEAEERKANALGRYLGIGDASDRWKGMTDRWKNFAALQTDLQRLPAAQAAARVDSLDKVDAYSLGVLVESELALADLAKARDATELAAEAWELFLHDFKPWSPDASTYQGFVRGLISIENAALTVAVKAPGDVSAERLAFWVVSSGRDRAFDDSGRSVTDSSDTTSKKLDAVRKLRARRAGSYLAALPGPVPPFPDSGRLQEMEIGLFQGTAIRGLALSLLAGGSQPFQQYDRKTLYRGSAEVFTDNFVRALGAGQALVEYARYAPVVVGGKRGQTAAPRYAALVVTKDSPPSVVDLGLADEVDRLTEAFRLLVRDPRSPLPSVQVAGKNLWQRIWAPIEPTLAHAAHVYVAADGALQLVPFESLYDGSTWLVDRQSLSYLNAPRDLLAVASTAASAARPSVVLASPLPPAKRYAFGSLDPKWYPPLAGAAAEAKTVAAHLGRAVTLTGAAVDEATLLAVKSPRVLHIAAHGLFLDDDGGPPGARGLRRVTRLPPDYEAKGRASTDEAWMRSMLVLSPPQTSSSTSPWDSYTTAYELARMDLKGTALAVLSACDAGVGIYGGGQGVRSMRRALAMAGAESVVASLWLVDDASTTAFMDVFYRELAASKARTEALRDAKLALKRDLRYAHPFYWAPFTLSGAITPL